MKAIVSYIFILSTIVYLHTYEGPKPVYKNNYRSPLPQRVIDTINESVAKSCERTDYQVAHEKIRSEEQSFSYQIELSNSPLEQGRVILKEDHSGEIVVQNIECPGKNGIWYSYTHPSHLTRQIAAN